MTPQACSAQMIIMFSIKDFTEIVSFLLLTLSATTLFVIVTCVAFTPFLQSLSCTYHFSTFYRLFSLQLAKDAEQVNKNIKKQCWNVWYEAYLLSSDESFTGLSTGLPDTSALSSGARRSSSNFENAPIAPAVLNSSALRKSRKVYCYISKKVCMNQCLFPNSYQD